MNIEGIGSGDDYLGWSRIRRPPELTREDLRPALPSILIELDRLDALGPGEIDPVLGYRRVVPGSLGKG